MTGQYGAVSGGEGVFAYGGGQKDIHLFDTLGSYI